MATDVLAPTRLRFLRSDHLEWPLPSDRLDVWCGEDARIGNLDGVIIDPAAHQVRYLVVGTHKFFKRQSYLLPINPTQIDVEHHALRVNIDSAGLARCATFEPDAFPNFSDDDLIEALFRAREETSNS